MKLSKEQIEEIKKLYKEGANQIEIAKQFNVKQSTITYWVNQEYRENKIRTLVEKFRNLPREKKVEFQKGRTEYMREYQRRLRKNKL